MTTCRFDSAWVEELTERLSRNQQVRRSLPDKGRLHIDRKLPFLCVYRRPTDIIDSGMERLIVGEAAYLKFSAAEKDREKISELIEKIVRVLVKEFGSFLILEVWSMRDWEAGTPVKNGLRKPTFKIVSDFDRTPQATLEILQAELRKIQVSDRLSQVSLTNKHKVAPIGCQPLLAPETAAALSCHLIGLEVSPIYRDTHGSVIHPLVRQTLHHKISQCLRQTFFQFMSEQTPKQPEHFHTLGRRAVVKAVWDIDERLTAIVNGFDFIMLNTPVNVNPAWKLFKRNNYREMPIFRYRPLPFSPPELKRQLYDIPIRRVEDPTLAALFEEERSQIDLRISMLGYRNTWKFLYGSLQLYGGVDDQILKLANEILARFRTRARSRDKGNWVNAVEFTESARKEIEYYQHIYAEFTPSVKIRKDVSTLMVNRGNLLVPESLKIRANRVNPLIQHEIGTHLLVHYNGSAQPFRLIRCGLPGYEELQEGLAVFAEFMVGGLSSSRLRVLAARVIAADSLTRGASFVETCADLQSKYDFDWHMAFLITTRVYRGGGLTKDVAYLRGLVVLFNYIKDGDCLDTLFVGKFGVSHIPIIEELSWRQVLKAPPLRPRYFESESSQRLLRQIRDGLTVGDLVKTAS